MEVKIKYHDGQEELFQNGDWVDLRASEDVEMKQFDFKLIKLGVSMQLPEGYEAIIALRSSTYKNFGIIQANSVGIVDEAYCGDDDIWMLPAIALRDTLIHKGDRIAQFRLFKHQEAIEFKAVETLGNENRGGFGTSGKK